MAKQRTVKDSLYLQVVILDNGNACFGKYAEQPTPTSTVITTESATGKKTQKNYELFDEIEGLISSVGVYDKESDAGAKWEMTSISVKTVEGSLENVQCNFKSRFSTSLILRLENIDLTKPVTLRVFRIKDKVKTAEKGKDVFNELLLPYQSIDGKLVSVKNKYAFIADAIDLQKNVNTNRLPEFKISYVTKNKVKTPVYDSSDYEEALRDIAKHVYSSIQSLKKVAESEVISEPVTSTADEALFVENPTIEETPF